MKYKSNLNYRVSYFYLKDHQGNHRVVLDQNDSIVQVNHYYSFGALFGESKNGEAQKYKYNGKELECMYELDLYDYGARMMDPVLERFTTPDPLCEKYYSTSPYAYCGNNPINRIDPTGETWRTTHDEDQDERKNPNSYEWVDDEDSYYKLEKNEIKNLFIFHRLPNIRQLIWRIFTEKYCQGGALLIPLHSYVMLYDSPNGNIIDSIISDTIKEDLLIFLHTFR